MAVKSITILCRKQITNNGVVVYTGTSKSIGVSLEQGWRVQPYADTSDTSIYSVLFLRPAAGVREEYYLAQTVATVVTASNA